MPGKTPLTTQRLRTPTTLHTAFWREGGRSGGKWWGREIHATQGGDIYLHTPCHSFPDPRARCQRRSHPVRPHRPHRRRRAPTPTLTLSLGISNFRARVAGRKKGRRIMIRRVRRRTRFGVGVSRRRRRRLRPRRRRRGKGKRVGRVRSTDGVHSTDGA